MVPFLLLNFGTFLKWYHFCLLFFVPFSNGTIFVAEFLQIPLLVAFLFQNFHTLFQWYHFCFRFFALCSNGTIFWLLFVAEFWNFSKMVPFLFVIFGTFLLPNFRTFLNSQLVPYLLQNVCPFRKWYYFCFIFSHLLKLIVPFSKPLSASVPFALLASKS